MERNSVFVEGVGLSLFLFDFWRSSFGDFLRGWS